MAIQLAVAHFLAVRIGGTAGRGWAWRAVLAALVSGGVVSCAVSSQAGTGWNKYVAYHQAEVARVINRTGSGLGTVSQRPGAVRHRPSGFA